MELILAKLEAIEQRMAMYENNFSRPTTDLARSYAGVTRVEDEGEGQGVVHTLSRTMVFRRGGQATRPQNYDSRPQNSNTRPHNYGPRQLNNDHRPQHRGPIPRHNYQQRQDLETTDHPHPRPSHPHTPSLNSLSCQPNEPDRHQTSLNPDFSLLAKKTFRIRAAQTGNSDLVQPSQGSGQGPGGCIFQHPSSSA